MLDLVGREPPEDRGEAVAWVAMGEAVETALERLEMEEQVEMGNQVVTGAMEAEEQVDPL